MAALLPLWACGAPRAPACDAPETRDLAAREAASVLAVRTGMRRVAGNPDRLAGQPGDTIRFTPGGGHVWVRHDEDRAVAILENVRSTGRDREQGAWTCAADFVLTRLSETPEAPLRIAIEYRSQLSRTDGRFRHEVRVIVP
ncbi:MAG TPA: hypothetical protein VF665_01005 [Longimicrobium sp.]|uniref:hypothetical protein n=1 Tax=Longimicrobium sp. TaxID=2029185 RepID=UPI002EDB59E8